jgi:hypothetical protein
MQDIKGALETFFRKKGNENLRLAELWVNWSVVMGPQLSQMARPLGRRKRTLVLGAQDSLVMQELVFFSSQILERIEGFLGWNPFDKVVFELLQGKTSLDQLSIKRTGAGQALPKPYPLGSLQEKMSGDSQIDRCYRKYVQVLGPELADKD